MRKDRRRHSTRPAERVETRLRRYKRRLKSHNSEGRGKATDVAYTVMAALEDNQEEVPEDYAPAVVAESTMSLQTMSVASAVVELDTKDSPVFVFRSGASGRSKRRLPQTGRQYRLD